MSTASMLAKCGLTAEQVSKMTKPKYLVAAENENGNCTRRKTTYKYWKQKTRAARERAYPVEQSSRASRRPMPGTKEKA